MNISFTGTTKATGHDCLPIHDALFALKQECEPKAFYSGGARGVDTLAACFALELFPQAEHHLVVPDGYDWNDDGLLQIDRWKSIIWVTGGYMKRNDALVRACDILLAFPKTAKEELRSGTWATVRRGRKAGRDVRIHPLH